MVRHTSQEAWRRINEEGLVGPFQLDVYNIIYEHGPMTAGEAWAFYKAQYPETFRGRNEVAKRCCELIRHGIVEETGIERDCKETGFLACEYVTNDKLPVKKEKPKLMCNCCGRTHTEKSLTYVRREIEERAARRRAKSISKKNGENHTDIEQTDFNFEC